MFGSDHEAHRAHLNRIERKLDLLIAHFGIEVVEIRPPAAVAAWDQGRKIEAIKEYRAATGAGLREAKEEVESWGPAPR